MTPEEINKAVAERVMGWHEGYGSYFSVNFGEVQVACWVTENNEQVWTIYNWNPAERIDHAWMGVEELKATIQVGPNHDKFVCYLWLENGIGAHEEADTAPMAICLAALEAVGGER
jgi:hypothetical protein